jgi:hypothetical protein
VDATTYEALKAKMPATKADKPVVSDPKKPAEPTKTTTPVGKVDKSVAELQAILYGVGWTTKKLTSDGLYGTQTKNAWAGSAKLRSLPQTFERVDGRTARVEATTYEALKSKMPVPGRPDQPKPGPDAPKPQPDSKDLVTKPARDLQKLLQAIGWRARTVAVSGKYDSNTAKAWAESSAKRGLDSTIGKVDDRTAKVSSKTFDSISAEVSGKKPDEPKPKPSELSPTAQAVVKISTEAVSAESLQQALAAVATKSNKEPLPITGVWGSRYSDSFLSDLWVPQQSVLPAWREAFPALVSSDGKTVKLPPNVASLVPPLAQWWIESQKKIDPAPIPGPEPPPVPGPVPYDPGPVPRPVPGPVPGPYDPGPYDPGPVPGPVPGPYDPGPVPGPVEPPPAPTPEPSAANGWSAATQALQNFTAKGPALEQGINDGKARGTLHPDVQAAIDQWLTSIDKLVSTLAQTISTTPELRAALDTGGGTVGFAGYGYGSELAAFLSELEGAADTAIELLRGSFKAASGLAGLGQPIPPQLAGLAARLGTATWVKLMELLKLPIVTAAGAAAVGGKALNDALNGEAEAYLAHEDVLAQLVAEGALTVEEYNAIKKPIPGKESFVGPVVLGVVALGGLWLYFKNRKAGGQNAFSR